MTLRPHFVSGDWLTEAGRYVEYARMCLADLERLVVEVNQGWPGPLGSSIKQHQVTAQFWELARRRELSSDSVKIYTAMAVEGFVNFYGVVRLTQPVFDKKYERFGLTTKTRMILLDCDSVALPSDHPLYLVAERISRRRRLVHPKAVELAGTPSAAQKAGELLPQGARAAYGDMMFFFEEFAKAVPAAAIHLPDEVRQELGK